MFPDIGVIYSDVDKNNASLIVDPSVILWSQCYVFTFVQIICWSFLLRLRNHCWVYRQYNLHQDKNPWIPSMICRPTPLHCTIGTMCCSATNRLSLLSLMTIGDSMFRHILPEVTEHHTVLPWLEFVCRNLSQRFLNVTWDVSPPQSCWRTINNSHFVHPCLEMGRRYTILRRRFASGTVVGSTPNTLPPAIPHENSCTGEHWGSFPRSNILRLLWME